MKDIEEIKTEGAHNALREQISNLQFQLTNRTFRDHKKNNIYFQLRECLYNAQGHIDNMHTCLNALIKGGAKDK